MNKKNFSICLGIVILGIALTTGLIATAQGDEGDNQKKPSTVYVYNHNPKDTFDNNAEGWILQQLGLQNLSPIPEKNIIRNNEGKIIGYKSTDGTKEAYDVNSGFTTNEAWKRVGKNGELHIAKHGIESGDNFKGGGIQLDGGKVYNGFGNGTGAGYTGKDGNPRPAYPLDERSDDSNITINLNSCHSANDPDGEEGEVIPVTKSAESAEGCSKVKGHTKKVFAKCSYKWEVTGLTTEQQNSVKDKVSEALKSAARKDGFPPSTEGTQRRETTEDDVKQWFSSLPATERAQRLREVIKAALKALNIDPNEVEIKVNITYEKNEEAPKSGEGGSYHVPTAVPLSGEGFVPFYYCESLLAAYLQVDPSTLLYSPIIHINHLGELPAPAPLGKKLASGLFEFETLNGEDAFTEDVTICFWTYSSPNEVEVLWLDSDTQTWNTPDGTLDVNYSDGHITIDTNTLGIYAAFEPEESVVIDDFESYTDNVELGEVVWQTWIDGREDPNNGSQVGYDEPPFMETEIVHSGRQSMPFFYTNIEGTTESVASRTFEPPAEWKADMVHVWIDGYLDNTGRVIFIQVNNKRAYQNVDLSEPEWQEVEVDLETLDVDWEMVTSLGLGVDGNYVYGLIFIDDIVLSQTESTE